MGLAERRAAKEFETKKFPALKEAIDKAAGFAVAIEVAWDKLATPDNVHLYDEAWEKVYFQPLAEAFAAICIDDMGKDALKGALNKVIVTNINGTYNGENIATFAGGVLTLDHEPFSNIGDVADRIKGITRTLESAL